MIRKVKSLGELAILARTDERYARLAMDSARNLGGAPASVDGALQWLRMNANETDSEAGVVAEVNLCRTEDGGPK